MIATKSKDLHRVSLDITDGPEMTDAFGSKHTVASVQITYVDREVTAIRIGGIGDSDMFVDNLDDTITWPTWLNDLVNEHRSA